MEKAWTEPVIPSFKVLYQNLTILEKNVVITLTRLNLAS